jgi:hypothetical protein
MGIHIMNDPKFPGGDVVNIKANVTAYNDMLAYVNEDIMPNTELFLDYNYPDIDDITSPEKQPAKKLKRSRSVNPK